MRIPLLIVTVLVAALLGGCATRKNESWSNASLRRELLEMCEVDQRVRQGFGPHVSAETIAMIEAVDARHLSRMKAIVSRHGWPGQSLVGKDGAHAAWLLVQHADSTFMAQCLPLLERAVTAGEASGQDYAYLLDRVRMQQGQPQIYGTQFTFVAGGELVLHPIEDPDQVDERRRAVGLPPMAEQEKAMREFYR
jgi:hypothetical protein